MIAISAKELNAAMVHNTHMRKSINMNPWIDENLHKIRGDLMMQLGKDVDITNATNLFLALGMKLYSNIKSQSKEFAEFQENVKALLASQKATRFEQFTKQLPTGTLKSSA